MWKGRFSQDPSERLRAYGESVSFDQRLALYDIQGSQAHAVALHQAGLLDEKEWKSIQSGLAEIAEEIGEGKFAYLH